MKHNWVPVNTLLSTETAIYPVCKRCGYVQNDQNKDRECKPRKNTKCGGINGEVDGSPLHCDCPAVPMTIVNDIYQAVLNNGTTNDSTDWIGVTVDLVKK